MRRICLGSALICSWIFFAYHAGHEPFEGGGADAVEHSERQGEGNAVERVVRLEAVAEFEFAVCGLPVFWELFFGDVRGGVLHEVVAVEEQQARVVALGGFEPGLEGADVGEGEGFQTAFWGCRLLFGFGVV